jgi:hypothetical protein
MTINYIKNYVQKEGAVIHMKNAKKYMEKVSDSGEDVWLSLKTSHFAGGKLSPHRSSERKLPAEPFSVFRHCVK